MTSWLISLRFLPGRLFSFSWVGSIALIALPEGKQWCTKKALLIYFSPLCDREKIQNYHSSPSGFFQITPSYLKSVKEFEKLHLIHGKDSCQQLWKPANLRVYAQPCGGRCRLPSTSYQGGQAWASSHLREGLPYYLVTLCYCWPAGTSKLRFMSWKLLLKILHLLLLCICLDVPLALDSHTKAHCSALFSH